MDKVDRPGADTKAKDIYVVTDNVGDSVRREQEA
jgi:hypothetical protein